MMKMTGRRPILAVLLAVTIGLMAGPFSTPVAAGSIGTVKADGIRHVTANEAAELIRQSPAMVILDVRTAAEFQQGHIKGAINIDFYGKDFNSLILALNPATAYLLHCRSGSRSGRTLSLMTAGGFKVVTHLDGGFLAWQSAGQSVAKD